MNDHFKDIVLKETGAKDLYKIEDIQTLWSGYGKISRYGLVDGDRKNVIIKHVQLPDKSAHPRGWNTDFSHQRKIRSYQIETSWYKAYARFCNDKCRIPECLALEASDDEFLIAMEDLSESGFYIRKNSVTIKEMKLCLSWLANFHAIFMGRKPAKLWPVGTYWHLDTRPDELEALDDINLKNAAEKIDKKLRATPFQSFVHGDAKLANFCFNKKGDNVAAVDFQYVGGGSGIKDVAYFIGSCFYEEDCERFETKLLDWYFLELSKAVSKITPSIDPTKLVKNWRGLYPFAWTDFHRFIKGWSPGHWKINGYSERIAAEVLAQL